MWRFIFNFCGILSLIIVSVYDFSIWLVIVCIITIIVKLILFIYTHLLYKKYKNLLLDANSKDHRNDCVITFVTLISCIFSLFGIYFIDGVVGIGIGVWIFITAIKIFIESYDVLMDKSIEEPIWLKNASNEYRDLYNRASKAEQENLAKCASYLIFESQYDIDEFWNNSQLKEKSEYQKLNESLSKMMPQVTERYTSELPYSSEFINEITNSFLYDEIALS